MCMPLGHFAVGGGVWRAAVPALPLARDVLTVAAFAGMWVSPESFGCTRAWPLSGARRTVDSDVNNNDSDLVLEVLSGPVANQPICWCAWAFSWVGSA